MLFTMLQVFQLLAQPHPVVPLLQRERAAGELLRGDPHVHVPQRPGGLPRLPALHGGGWPRLPELRPGQPHALRQLQRRLHAEPGAVQARGGRLHRALHWLRDRPAGPGDEVFAAEDRQEDRGARHLHQQRHAPQQLVRPLMAQEDAADP